MVNPINVQYLKQVKEGEPFWLIQADGTIVQDSFTPERNVWKYDFKGKGIGTITKAPAGTYVAVIQIANKFKHRFIWRSAATPEEAAKIAFEEREVERRFEEDMANPKTELEYLERVYDQYHEYSDDHSVWAAGNAQKKRIEELKKQLTAGE